MRRLRPLLIAILAAGCGAVPQPFRHQTTTHLVVPQGTAVVAVRPVADAAEPDALAEAMAAALRRLDVPASAGALAGGGTVLEGRAAGQRLYWTLSGPAGEALAEYEQDYAPDALAVMPADALAAMVEPAAQALAEPLRPRPIVSETAIAVLPVSGARGAAGAELAEAMRAALARSGFAVADEKAATLVLGAVTIQPGPPGQDLVMVEWTVAREDGEIVGTIAQDGQLPSGRLATPLGSLARDIAEAGAEGVSALLRGGAPSR